VERKAIQRYNTGFEIGSALDKNLWGRPSAVLVETCFHGNPRGKVFSGFYPGQVFAAFSLFLTLVLHGIHSAEASLDQGKSYPAPRPIFSVEGLFWSLWIDRVQLFLPGDKQILDAPLSSIGHLECSKETQALLLDQDVPPGVRSGSAEKKKAADTLQPPAKGLVPRASILSRRQW